MCTFGPQLTSLEQERRSEGWLHRIHSASFCPSELGLASKFPLNQYLKNIGMKLYYSLPGVPHWLGGVWGSRAQQDQSPQPLSLCVLTPAYERLMVTINITQCSTGASVMTTDKRTEQWTSNPGPASTVGWAGDNTATCFRGVPANIKQPAFPEKKRKEKMDL